LGGGGKGKGGWGGRGSKIRRKPNGVEQASDRRGGEMKTGEDGASAAHYCMEGIAKLQTQ